MMDGQKSIRLVMTDDDLVARAEETLEAFRKGECSDG